MGTRAHGVVGTCGGATEALAIIPARGGSKGLPSKNIAVIRGEPLILRAIRTARASAVNRVAVSTDSREVADWVDWPVMLFDQPSATDTSLPEQAERYVLERMWQRERYRPQVIVRLFCTAPFTSPTDINACLALIDRGARAVVSVCEPTAYPSQLVRVRANGTIRHLTKKWQRPRQAWSNHRQINGAVYAARLDYYESHGFIGPETVAYEMPRDRSLDIDTQWDLEVARALA